MYDIGSLSKKYKNTSLTLIDTCLLPLLKIMGDLFLEHVELPHVLVLAVHLVNFVCWMVRGRWVGGPWDSCDCPSPLVLGFGDFGIGDRACQLLCQVMMMT